MYKKFCRYSCSSPMEIARNSMPAPPHPWQTIKDQEQQSYVCINTDGQIFRYPIVQNLFASPWSMAGSYFPRYLSCDGMVGGARSYWCLLEYQLHDVRMNQKENPPPGNSSRLRWAGWVPLRWWWMTFNLKVLIDYRHFRYR